MKYFIATAIALSNALTLGLFSKPAEATNSMDISCDRENSVPTVVITFSKHNSSQTSPILSFLPQYFPSQKVENECQNTAQKLKAIYSMGRMKYLASDTIEQKPVVCAVERRGLRCDNYSSEILFSSNKPVDPTELLYNMLGDDFKGFHQPSSRSVDRIYTDLRPQWWPF